MKKWLLLFVETGLLYLELQGLKVDLFGQKFVKYGNAVGYRESSVLKTGRSV